jgi:chemotaxis protein MotB
MAHLLGIAAVGLALTGCVSTEKYNALKLDRDSLAEQLSKSQADGSAARAEADSYKNQLNMLGQGQAGTQGLVANLTSQLSELQKQYDALNSQYADAMKNRGTGTALPAELSSTLSQFAQQNPDLVDFDAARGIVKFKSDVTFAPGSADVNPRAKEVIAKFASILNSQAASGYELMVAGHTDNTRVVNPETIKHGHLDNWYLSAHRAISVANLLKTDHVNEQRLAVTGYADQRPIASNATESGKEKNRRVEVLILPTTVRTNTFATEKAAPTHAPKKAAMNKDTTVNAPQEKLLNK